MRKKVLIGLVILIMAIGSVSLWTMFNPNEALSANGKIQTPINTSVDNTTWTAISLGAAQTCQGFVAKSRGGDDWKVSDSSAGTKYITIDGATSLSMDITGQRGETLFYVQSATGAETIEVLITSR